MLEDLAWIRYGYCHYGAAFACSLNLRFPGIIPAFARGYISIPLCGTRICQDRPLSDYLIQGQHRRSGSHRQAPGHHFCTLLDSENPWWSVVFCSICMVWVFIGFIIFFFFAYIFLAFSIPIALNSQKEQIYIYHPCLDITILYEITRNQHLLYFDSRAVRIYLEFMVLWSDSFYT